MTKRTIKTLKETYELSLSPITSVVSKEPDAAPMFSPSDPGLGTPKAIESMPFAQPEERLEGYADFSYGKLGTILAATQGLLIVAQTSHWAAKGSNFYPNHLLFERVYNTMNDLIDPIAEKAVGMAKTGDIADPCRLLKNAYTFVEETKNVSNDDLTRKVYLAVCQYKKIVTKAYTEIKADGVMTPGVENLLQTVLDKAEQLEYLLGRIQAGLLG